MVALSRVYLAVYIVFVASSGVQAAPAAEDVLAAYRAQLGFSDALSQYGTIEAHAHVRVGDRAYDTVAKAEILPGGLGDADFTIIRDGVATLYSNKGGALTRTVAGGAPEALPASMAAFIHGHQFHQRVLYPGLTLASMDGAVGEENFAGRAAFKIAGKTAGGDPLMYFFDAASKQMLGFQLIITEETGSRPLDFVLGDWNSKGGQTLFWRLEITDKDDLYIYEYNKIMLLP